MSKRKIINDPIYGLISFPHELIYDIIDHPWFQRLRRISQMGLSTYVYPGANHSRFSHALGAVHLMITALDTLRQKGVDINDEEYEAACLAILLHDVGHGPFSHALEFELIDKAHESISLDIMKFLNTLYDGRLTMAIEIFRNRYKKKFLTQLVSSQLDMDRMDYLTRDSYYSGVAEGVIGYKRIISMLNVIEGELVIEKKGVFSIEKFIVARYIMYWQVYLHKTSIAAEQMLKSFIVRFKELCHTDPALLPECRLKSYFINNLATAKPKLLWLEEFLLLDDIDIYSCLKLTMDNKDDLLRFLARAIINRTLFKVKLQNKPFTRAEVEEIKTKISENWAFDRSFIDKLLIMGEESSRAYDSVHEEIKILSKDGTVDPVSSFLDSLVNVKPITKYYICYPVVD